MNVSNPPAAVHLPGGNDFDDLRIDIAASHELQTEWLRGVERRRPGSSRMRGYLKRKRDAFELRAHLREALVAGGVHHSWFDEFHSYWRDVLHGRPLTVQDFHHLRFHYRRQAQHTGAFDWSSREAHLRNWQEPSNLSATFFFVYRAALAPFRAPAAVLECLRGGTRVLEYGCGIAPVFGIWRDYLAARDVEWVLADLANFPFHYARHVHAGAADFVVIDDFNDPLVGVDGKFDSIIVQDVFEHLDRPRHIAEYLVNKLSPGGAFAFNFEQRSGLGHDTPRAVAERTDTLEFLRQVLGLDSDDAARVGAGDFVVARK
jgi:2-polyprenyl-3-methyl-5-hydroxy-6-metoxy-1,4-benzoquinol methylase